MHRRAFRTQCGEFLRIAVGDQPLAEAAEPVGDLLRPGEGNLHGHLLIQKHPDEQGERILGQERIRSGILCQLQLRHARQSRSLAQASTPLTGQRFG